MSETTIGCSGCEHAALHASAHAPYCRRTVGRMDLTSLSERIAQQLLERGLHATDQNVAQAAREIEKR